ncbi:hypothetical protein A5701_21000 [Mycobacterium sp. E3305]|nr:hypothetical protein A5701_21000 [Mycobacterium sp. E3305]
MIDLSVGRARRRISRMRRRLNRWLRNFSWRQINRGTTGQRIALGQVLTKVLEVFCQIAAGLADVI